MIAFTLFLLIIISTSGNESGDNCFYKNRIIVDVSDAGIGNRLLTIVSASLLAFSMDRVLEVKWSRSGTCSALYEELFLPNRVTHRYIPFLYGDEETKKRVASFQSVSHKKSACSLELGRRGSNHYAILSNTEYFSKLDKKCHIIYLHSKHYFGHFLLSSDYAGDKKILKETFYSPFARVADTILNLHEDMKQEGRDFLLGRMKGKPWLSIHSRGFYDTTGQSTEKALRAAVQWIQQDIIGHVFFATESSDLILLAKHIFSTDELKAVLIISKSFGTIGGDAHTDSSATSDEDDSAFGSKDLVETKKALLDWCDAYMHLFHTPLNPPISG